MAKGQDQAAETAAICRQLALQLSASTEGGEGSPLAVRLNEQAERLEKLQHRLFLKMGPAVRLTEPCLASARELQKSLAAGAAASDLEAQMQTLEAAVTALETKAMSPGSIVIT